ncbi:unnamed protein product [Heligmosomoides polygyrus]|uniref:Transcription initiation factor TFIID subunit 8 n=1 Tax=Heligmosomoides polygyrus TaxID=6339 RepID=A0A3P8ATD5_HELPZ|nr:unnamed protein product [Heligmosomoides polygyrus]
MMMLGVDLLEALDTDLFTYITQETTSRQSVWAARLLDKHLTALIAAKRDPGFPSGYVCDIQEDATITEPVSDLVTMELSPVLSKLFPTPPGSQTPPQIPRAQYGYPVPPALRPHAGPSPTIAFPNALSMLMLRSNHAAHVNGGLQTAQRKVRVEQLRDSPAASGDSPCGTAVGPREAARGRSATKEAESAQ